MGEIRLTPVIKPMEYLLGTKLRLLRVQPRFLQAAANLRLVEAKKVNAAIRARGHGARHRHGIDVSGNLHGAHIGKSRSEEHTSELQSLMRISYAVFCLKKKTTT